MEEYLKNINLDKIIAIFGFALTVASIIYAYKLNKKNKIERRISLNRGESYSIIKNSPSLKTDELKLYWDKKKVSNIYILEIFLKNSGTISLKNDDFLKPIDISFDRKIEILRPKVFSSSEYSKIKWNYSKNDLTLDIKLLEANKIIKAEIIYTYDKVLPVNIDIAILDGNLENISLKNLGDELYDIKQNGKTRSFVVFYGYFLIIFLICALLIKGIFKGLEYLDYYPSTYLEIWIAAPIVIIALIYFFSVLKKESEIEFVKNWTEFQPDN